MSISFKIQGSSLIFATLTLGIMALGYPQLGAAQPKIPTDSPVAARDVEPAGYLVGKSIGYDSPPAPDNRGPNEPADLGAVERAQAAPEWMRQQAFEDAGAYNYDQLLPRFSQAAGTQLSVQYYPVLAYVLRRMLVDLSGTKGTNSVTISGYITVRKKQAQRDRPYLEDSSIIPCEIDFLHGDSDQQSYPSGHAANGYAAALMLAKVMPDRAPLLLARGTRYGDNRVVCGVHHPTDIEEGRRIAQAYFAELMKDAVFKKELACAMDERGSVATSAHPSLPVPSSDWPIRCREVLAAAGAHIN